MVTLNCLITLTHSLTAALDQLRVVASSTSIDPGPRSGQHQQIGQYLLPLVAAIEVIKKLETARTPASLAATDAGTRWT